MIVCAAIIYTVLPESVVPVDADKNTKQKVEEKDGVVIINEGDVEGDSGEVSITETDWDKIEDLKEYVPNLYIPGYVPEGYEFEKATVVRYSEGLYKSDIVFVDDKNEIISIAQTTQKEDSKTIFIEQYEEKFECSLGEVYIVKYQKGISGTLISGHERIFIFGNISSNEMKNICESLDET